MITSITKEKIPHDYSFVLKTSLLEETLERSNITIDVLLAYSKPNQTGSFFEAHYWLPNDRIPYERLYIVAGAVSKKDVFLAREGLRQDILPQFAQWIMEIGQLSANEANYRERYFNGSFINKRTYITMD